MKSRFEPNFVKAVEIQGGQCKGKVPKLEEGVQYQFRVRAVNKAGPGEPSEETNPHTAKPRWRKYTLHSLSPMIKNTIGPSQLK